MRLLKSSISLALLVSMLASLVSGATVVAITENFRFEDFAGDYYLSRDDEGVSRLKVVENFTTVFPNYQQNKGICREIPFTNQDNKNVTLSNLSREDIKVTRNGASEPIYSIEKNGTYYEVCTGTDDYVLGTQVYTFEYEFTKVVTDFAEYQELYWDTNGNGWWQEFGRVKARVHFEDGSVRDGFDGGKWCYVGRYGENGAERCEISEIEDGWQFQAVNLKRYENLTFDVEFKAGTFVVPEPERNYILIYVLIGVGIICGLLLISPIKKFMKTREKRKFYRDYFIKPEYQPHVTYSVAEMTENYIGKTEDSKIGVLLDMLIKKQIRLMKEGKNYKIVVLKLADISPEGVDLLRILAGGGTVADGDEIEIKKHKPTAELAKIGRSYDKAITMKIRHDGLMDTKYAREKKTKVGANDILWIMIMLIGFVFPIVMSMAEVVTEMIEEFATVGVIVGEEIFVPTLLCIIMTTIVIRMILGTKTKKYLVRTMKGLEASRYMDGLKLYIEMAEADRIKLLQSVNGVDVSPEGIVHLYEKLLPYAAVLGLEKSWMAEMEKYYKIAELSEPEWSEGMSSSDLLVAMHFATRLVDRSTSYVASGSTGSISGGGGFSSGFSGGGGGGFSGGGGGGGGGHGR